MSDDSGTLSFDFLVGFTIFIIAFIWVVSLVPGLLINLQGYTIDYDAVAYRTGVILVEDPGEPLSWEVAPFQENFYNKSNVLRFGLAVSRDDPNILSLDKVNRFFDNTSFPYMNDYRTRAIFGDYPYGFNISLRYIGSNESVKSVGDPLPDGYGYIRRLVKVKTMSTATIDGNSLTTQNNYVHGDNETTHRFSILLNNTNLVGKNSTIKDPAYQIIADRESFMINLTNLNSTMNVSRRACFNINLTYVGVTDGSNTTGFFAPIIDEVPINTDYSQPIRVMNNVSILYNTTENRQPLNWQAPEIKITLTFDLVKNGSAPGPCLFNGSQFLNNTYTPPFIYDYNQTNVTQPQLRDAVLEVAIWSGTTTTQIGPVPTPIPENYIIYSTAGSGGTISPSGSVSVTEGDNKTFTIANNTGYHIADVLVDGFSVGPVLTYNFTNVKESHMITASFAVDTYTINASAGSNGIISPSGVVSVNYNANQMFTISPNPTYHIQTLVVDGSTTTYPPLIPPTYNFTNIQANHTISVTFEPNTPQVFFSDNFDAAFSVWTAGDTDYWYSGSPKNGSHSIQLRGTESMTQTISTTDYSGISVSFAMGAYNLDNSGEYVIAEWSPDGLTWNSMQQISDGQDDSQLHVFTFSAPPTADDMSAFALRFRIQSNSHANDYGYIDDVQITGIPI